MPEESYILGENRLLLQNESHKPELSFFQVSFRYLKGKISAFKAFQYSMFTTVYSC